MTPSTNGAVIKLPVLIDREQFNNVVSAAYTAYLSHGHVPSIDEISTYTNVRKKTIAKILDTPEFVEVITSRGVNWISVRGLSAKQMLSLSVLTNPSDRRDMRAKLRSIGATYAEYQAWMKQPLYHERINAVAEEMLSDNIGNVHQALANQATGGNIRAIELYYQITGRFDPASKQVAQMEVIIKLLLEILTKRITDRDLLALIANDISTEVMPKMVTGTIVKG